MGNLDGLNKHDVHFDVSGQLGIGCSHARLYGELQACCYISVALSFLGDKRVPEGQREAVLLDHPEVMDQVSKSNEVRKAFQKIWEDVEKATNLRPFIREIKAGKEPRAYRCGQCHWHFQPSRWAKGAVKCPNCRARQKVVPYEELK